MKHCVNQFEDVLVAPENFIPSPEWFNISNLNSSDGMYLSAVGIYNTAKVLSQVDYTSEPTQRMCELRKFDELGFEIDPLLERDGFPEKYKWYQLLMLCTLYGGNCSNCEILQPFTLSAEYIKTFATNYDGEIIENKVADLITQGYIKI